LQRLSRPFAEEAVMNKQVALKSKSRVGKKTLTVKQLQSLLQSSEDESIEKAIVDHLKD
jgi:hypothetical protein